MAKNNNQWIYEIAFIMRLIYKVAVKLIPIMLGYFPVGISFAIIASASGLSNAEIISMSIFVLGAASQIAAIPLIDAGYSVFYIFLITLLINFRHAAFSATLAPSLREFSAKELAIFSYGLTDEAFTIHVLDIENNKFNKPLAIAVNVGTHLIWVTSTVAGCYLGFFITGKMDFLKLDFALLAMFLSIVVVYAKSKIVVKKALQIRVLLGYLMIIVVTGVLTLLLLFAGFKSLSFFVPSLAIATFIFSMGKLNFMKKLQ